MQDITKIYDSFLKGNCSEEELKTLLEHFGAEKDFGTDKEILAKKIEDKLSQYTDGRDISVEEQIILKRNWDAVRKKTNPYLFRSISQKQKKKWGSYAAVFLFVVFGVWLYSSQSNIKDGEDKSPASTLALLTLSDGSQIRLDSLTSEGRYQDQGVNIAVQDDGAILYYGEEDLSDNNIGSNTVSTPLGGTYKIILPDSTKVWLNAGSVLTFPVRFSKAQRKVTLEGEAFFDVKRDVSRPFVVSTAGENIEVLGTTFNVSAYADNSPVTTLVTGKVVLSRGGDRQSLLPHEQGVWLDGEYVISTVDVHQFTSWKDGWFVFHDVPLREIMVQLSRWYDVEVDLESLPDVNYYGEFSRALPLSKVLEMMEANGNLKWQLKGGKITMK